MEKILWQGRYSAKASIHKILLFVLILAVFLLVGAWVEDTKTRTILWAIGFLGTLPFFLFIALRIFVKKKH